MQKKITPIIFYKNSYKIRETQTLKKVSCKCMFHIAGSEYAITTGGDDNAISVIHISVSSTHGENIQVVETAQMCEKHAHGTQITGLKFITKETILSVSVDQRLCKWRVMKCSNEYKVCIEYLMDQVPLLLKMRNYW